jgi:phospholipid/cholesterol/gamma-HCH transport system substrate-binding protein
MRSLRRRVMAVLVMTLVLSGCSSFDGVYDLPLPGNKVAKDEGFLVSAEFADALNVVPRSAVMVGDVPVGQIETVRRVGWHARVTMRVRNDVKLPDDAVAEIRQTSLLGEKFVALEPPTSDSGEKVTGTGRLSSGDVIPMDRTGRNPEVEEVLGALSFLLSGGGVGQLQTITQELNLMMEGRTGKIKDVLGRLNTLVGTLDAQRGDIVQALDSINGLSATLIKEKKTIGEALDAAGPAIKVLRKQHTQLVRMLSELDKLGVVGTRVVKEIKDDLLAELRHLEPLLRNLADIGDEPTRAPNCEDCGALVPGLVAAAGYPFPMDALDPIHGDFANVVFKMQFKLIPVSEGGLIPTTLDDLVQLCRSVPTAPLCSPLGDAVEKLCTTLPSLPLCSQTDLIAGVLGNLLSGGGPIVKPSTPTEPDAGQPTPTPDANGGAGGSPLQRLLGGLLGGGTS